MEAETLVWKESAFCHVSACYWTIQLSTGQLVKVNSQVWSKLQKWLNKRGRIRNWTGIKLLIN